MNIYIEKLDEGFILKHGVKRIAVENLQTLKEKVWDMLLPGFDKKEVRDVMLKHENIINLPKAE